MENPMIVDCSLKAKSFTFNVGMDVGLGWIYFADVGLNRVLRESISEQISQGNTIHPGTIPNDPLFTKEANGPVYDGGITRPSDAQPIPGMSFLHGFLQNGTAQPPVAPDTEIPTPPKPRLMIVDDFDNIRTRLEELRRDKCL